MDSSDNATSIPEIDATLKAMKAGLRASFNLLKKKDFKSSPGLIEAFSAEEGRIFSHIPMIDFRYVKHVNIPWNFASGDGNLDARFIKHCKEDRKLGPLTIQRIQESMNSKRETIISNILKEMRRKGFKLDEGETEEEIMKANIPAHLPFVFLHDDAVSGCTPLVIHSKRIKADIYVLRASMPPCDIERPLFMAYVENCVQYLSLGIKANTHQTLYFTYLLTDADTKIVFFISLL